MGYLNRPILECLLLEYLAHYNENSTPFVGTAKANDILKKVERARKKLQKIDKLYQL